MSLLGFLKKANVEEVTAAAKVAASGPRKQRQPNPAMLAIRVWKDGSIFPSQAAVSKFDLEYREATITKETLPKKEATDEDKFRNKYEFPNGTGNGLDLIDSREWPQFKGDGQMLFVAVVSKDAGKVDMFSTTNYDEAGKPKVSVLDQGANTFGKDVLIPAIEEVYGIKFQRDAKEATKDRPAQTAQEGVNFVDLEIFESLGEGEEAVNVTEKFSKPILHVPKRITRGENKGKSDYTRRENVKVYGFAPVEVLHPGQEESQEETEEIQDLTNASPAERAAALRVEEEA